MNNIEPQVRVHLWIESEEGMIFGPGRVQLIESIEKYGSLIKAAKNIRISYRAAWGKIKKTEEILGDKLIIKSSNQEGFHLTEFGKNLNDKYKLWLEKVEQYAVKEFEEIFSWNSKSSTDSDSE